MSVRFLYPLGILLALLWVSHSQAMILPPNQLHLEDSLLLQSNVDQRTFNAILNEIEFTFTPIFATFGATLVVKRLWKDNMVNAFADQNGLNWSIHMYGGLARRPEITPDGFALIACHEIGHHLGGFSFYPGEDWAASEGQSDYFAAQACAKLIWGKKHKENARAAATVDSSAQIGCDLAWTSSQDRNLCYRVANAAQSLASFMAALDGIFPPNFKTPDLSQVKTSEPYHPYSQCRLDTYMQAALCDRAFDFGVIPGKEHPSGQDSLDAEKEALPYSCTRFSKDSFGVRPLCWYAPQL